MEEQEEYNGRLVLNSTYQLAVSAHQNLLDWESFALQTRKEELHTLLNLATAAMKQLDISIQHHVNSPAVGQAELLQQLRKLQFGNNNYLVVLDGQGNILSHPSNQFNGMRLTQAQQHLQGLDLQALTASINENGEGFSRYQWKPSPEEPPSEKLAYFRYLPEYDWILAATTSIQDVETQIEQRRGELIQRLREQIHQTRISQTGYLFVFDSNMDMIIHPNPNLEGKNVSERINPLTNRSLAHELMAVANSDNEHLVYQWDKPSDPGHYIYEKISWVKYLPEFDWYMASSVYMDELERTANALTYRLLIIAAVILVITFIAAYFFLNRLIHPITILADLASKVRDGNLNVRTNIKRRDEIGLLATTFNAMVTRLKDQMDHMEKRVEERTARLAETVQHLETRNHESSVFTRMGELLLSCHSEDEVFTVTLQACQALFPMDSGSAYRVAPDRHLQRITQWGDEATPQQLTPAESCWAVRRGQSHTSLPENRDNLCPYCQTREQNLNLCVPLQAEGSVTGIIRIQFQATDSANQDSRELARRETLLTTAAEHATLSLINLRLRERLHQQSIRDTLTGLYNRRQLEASLTSELSRAQRHQEELGIIMLDIDYFKDFNDNHGHEVGDQVLKLVGQLLQNCLRKEDIACRYGGEEFTLIIPETHQQGLRTLAELIRERVEKQINAQLGRQVTQPVTVSLGLARYPQDGNDKNQLLKAADSALYLAKKRGRNQLAEASENK